MKAPQILASVLTLLLLTQANAFAVTPKPQNPAQSQPNPMSAITVNGQPVPIGSVLPLSYCLPMKITATPYATTESTSVHICDQDIQINPFLLSQTAASLQLSPPYNTAPFTVQCLATNMGATVYYAPSLATICNLRPCEASSVTFCGKTFQVPAGTTVGNTINIPVPNVLLARPSLSNDQSITAQCRLSGDKVAYEISDTSGVSCNDFPCPDADVQLCNTPIHINGGTAFADVLGLTMPPPFASDKFTVQCVSDNISPPTYQILDRSAVTCATGK